MIRKGNAFLLRKGRFSQTARTYLVTFATQDRMAWFNDFELGRVVVEVLKSESHSSKTLAFVIMPDHVHWLVQLDKKSLDETVHSVKSVSAHRINGLLERAGAIWQSGFHDHAVRKDEDLLALARYVVMNPVKAGLVSSIREYALWDAIWV